MGGGTGSQSSWAIIFVKSEFLVLFIPIFASVSFRQIPSASVDFRRLSTTIPTYIVGGADNNVCGRGAGSQSFWAVIFVKSGFSVLLIPIFASVIFRQLPSASAGFRGLP